MVYLLRFVTTLFIASLLIGTAWVSAQTSYTIDGVTYQSDDLLPIDPALRTGELDNGLNYYIRKNQEPENRARFGLVIDAGSLLEEDDQQGVAHFLEHMLFNGTESFSGNELDDYIESIGMKFGAHLNAYTSFDETVYFLEIPMDNPEFLETGIQILQEWASAATLELEEIDKERGVVIEEERARMQNVSGRVSQVMVPFTYGSSRYAERLPIGKVDILGTAPREAFTRYYDTWYRPDLMALIAVGDFDVDDIESKIKESFSPLQNPSELVERTQYDIEAEEGTRYLVFEDSEFPYVLAQISLTDATEDLVSFENYRDLVKGSLFSSMFNLRLEEKGREADTPFLFSQLSSSNISRRANSVEFAFVTDENQEALEAGFKGMYEEINRVAQFGFTEGELDRAKENLLTGYKENFDQRTDRDNSGFVSEYTRLYLENEASPGIEFEYALVQEILPTINTADFADFQELIVSEDNRAIALLAPEKDGLELPDETGLAAIVEVAQTTEAEAYKDDISDAQLFTADLTPIPSGKVNYNETLELFDFTLENGITVYFKETDYTPEEVNMSASSAGGLSLLEDYDYLEGSYINSILSDSGIAEFDASQLIKLLSGENVGVGVSFSDYSEGFSGNAATEDLERLFQLVYLNVTEPRKDEVAFDRFVEQASAALQNRAQNPQAAFQDALTEVLYGDNVRFNVPSVEEIQEIDFDRAFEIYQERVSNLDDLKVFFVGDTTLENIQELSEKYLANIEIPTEAEKTINRQPTPPPAGVTVRKVYKGQEEQSAVHIEFSGAFDASLKNRVDMVFASEVMNIMARESLREDLGGVYGVSVRSNIQFEPYDRFTFSIDFGCDPERVDELVDAIFEIIEELRTNGAPEETLTKVIEQRKRSHEERLTENSYWSSILSFYYTIRTQEDPAQILGLPEVYESVTSEDVQNVAKVYLNPENYIKVVLYPEAYENQ